MKQIESAYLYLKKMTNTMFSNSRVSNWHKYYFVFCVLIFSVMIFIMPEKKHESDMWCWILWARAIYSHGIGNIYQSHSNYMPIYFYILKLYGLLQESYENIHKNINTLKFFTLIFHFGSTYFILLIIDLYSKEQVKKLLAVFYFFNISVLYNSLVWGQVDEIESFFLIGMIYFYLANRHFYSLIFFLLAVNFKLQAIIYLPILFLLMASHLKDIKHLQPVLIRILILVLIELSILLPFILTSSLDEVWKTVVESVDMYPVVSANAYNFWFFIFNDQTNEIQDSMVFLGMTLKYWGLCMFFGMSLLVFLPWIFRLVRYFKSEQSIVFKRSEVLLISGLIPLIFFYFNTQMHERYCHVAIIFLITYCILEQRIMIGLLATIAYLLNLEGVLQSLAYQAHHVFIFDPRFISSIFLSAILLGFYYLYCSFHSNGLLEET